MSEFQHSYEGGETQCVHCRGWTRGANLRTECPTRLRAEVERLRAEVEHEKGTRIAAYAGGGMDGRDAERVAVVAWLRDEAKHYSLYIDMRRCEIRADHIERGEHHSAENDQKCQE